MANDWTYYANLANDEENARNNALRDQEATTEQRLQVGQQRVNDEFNGAFTPQFYQDYANKLMNYWRPDIDQQYGDASRTLNYNYADTQPGGGSAPAEGFGRLNQAYGQALLQAQDNATSQANQLKQSNEQQRSQLLGLLGSGADPSTVVPQALNSIASVPTSPSYSPLGDIFSGITGQFAIANQAARNGYPGWGFGAIGGGAPGSSAGGNGSLVVGN